ncbi:MAG: ABC transporter permease [Acholeplasmatales bacterium]|nr:ABC transporter permease [Acholeplasmatales bacterium]
MVILFELVKRNLKLYFKDRGLFFSSLITPLILLVLYATFLAKVYKDSFISNIPDGVNVSETIINSVVAGQLISSLLAVSCVTIAFCSNLIMITDKANERIYDLTVTPVKKTTLSLAYYISSALSTLIITLSTLGVCFIYLATQGFYMSGLEVFKTILDVILLTLFGTSLSCVIGHFCKTNGAASAIGTLVSSIYGFISGAYMPLSQFNKGLQHVISFLPGTYGTSLIKAHMISGSLRELEGIGASQQMIDGIAESIDSRYYFFDNLVGEGAKYIVMILSIVIFTSIFVLLNILQNMKKK